VKSWWWWTPSFVGGRCALGGGSGRDRRHRRGRLARGPRRLGRWCSYPPLSGKRAVASRAPDAVRFDHPARHPPRTCALAVVVVLFGFQLGLAGRRVVVAVGVLVVVLVGGRYVGARCSPTGRKNNWRSAPTISAPVCRLGPGSSITFARPGQAEAEEHDHHGQGEVRGGWRRGDQPHRVGRPAGNGPLPDSGGYEHHGQVDGDHGQVDPRRGAGHVHYRRQGRNRPPRRRRPPPPRLHWAARSATSAPPSRSSICRPTANSHGVTPGVRRQRRRHGRPAGLRRICLRALRARPGGDDRGFDHQDGGGQPQLARPTSGKWTSPSPGRAHRSSTSTPPTHYSATSRREQPALLRPPGHRARRHRRIDPAIERLVQSGCDMKRLDLRPVHRTQTWRWPSATVLCRCASWPRTSATYRQDRHRLARCGHRRRRGLFPGALLPDHLLPAPWPGVVIGISAGLHYAITTCFSATEGWL